MAGLNIVFTSIRCLNGGSRLVNMSGSTGPTGIVEQIAQRTGKCVLRLLCFRFGAKEATKSGAMIHTEYTVCRYRIAQTVDIYQPVLHPDRTLGHLSRDTQPASRLTFPGSFESVTCQSLSCQVPIPEVVPQSGCKQNS